MIAIFEEHIYADEIECGQRTALQIYRYFVAPSSAFEVSLHHAKVGYCHVILAIYPLEHLLHPPAQPTNYPPSNLPFQLTLSTHPLNPPSQPTLSTHLLTLPFQLTLSPHPISTHTPTHPLTPPSNLPSQPTLQPTNSPHPPSTLSTHSLTHPFTLQRKQVMRDMAKPKINTFDFVHRSAHEQLKVAPLRHIPFIWHGIPSHQTVNNLSPINEGHCNHLTTLTITHPLITPSHHTHYPLSPPPLISHHPLSSYSSPLLITPLTPPPPCSPMHIRRSISISSHRHRNITTSGVDCLVV